MDELSFCSTVEWKKEEAVQDVDAENAPGDHTHLREKL
uniref:Uncharacterized protein n=1 Tax=Arundo donax TaxID=35708 RepID=A0A0A9HSS3_ARUDO